MKDPINGWYTRGWRRRTDPDSGRVRMVYEGEYYTLDPGCPMPRVKRGTAAACALYTVVYLLSAVFVSEGAMWRWVGLFQILTLVPLIYFSRKNSSILRLGKTKYDGRAIWKACTNGSSEFMSNISMSLVGMLYNLQLIKYAGEDGVAAYGVMMYVSMIFAAVFIGYSIGTAPVIGFHDGAQNHDELHGLLRKSLIMIGLFGIGMIAAAELLAVPLSRIFVGYDPELMALTVSGFRIFGLSFGFMGFAIFFSSFFTALNDGITSAIISFLRTLVFQSVAVMILPQLWGIHGVWISIVVAEFMAVVLGTLFLIAKRKKYHY